MFGDRCIHTKVASPFYSPTPCPAASCCLHSRNILAAAGSCQRAKSCPFQRLGTVLPLHLVPVEGLAFGPCVGLVHTCVCVRGSWESPAHHRTALNMRTVPRVPAWQPFPGAAVLPGRRDPEPGSPLHPQRVRPGHRQAAALTVLPGTGAGTSLLGPPATCPRQDPLGCQ